MNSGILLLDKPTGSSSAQALYPVKRSFPGRKVGHTGTLDPFASGLLVILVGQATRLSRFFLKLDKAYTGIMKLGEETDTLDRLGTVTATAEIPDPAHIQEVLPRFKGSLLQQPPRFSALKVKGKRAYHLARQGIEPELSPREVSVYRISAAPLVSAAPAANASPTADATPVLGAAPILGAPSSASPDPRPSHYTLDVHCGSGTYIRALARDIGRAAGSFAYLEELRRTQVGPFGIDEVHPERLIPIPDALRRLGSIPVIATDSAGSRSLRAGKPLNMSLQKSLHDCDAVADSSYVLIVDDQGREAALLERTGAEMSRSDWRYTAVFTPGDIR